MPTEPRTALHDWSDRARAAQRAIDELGAGPASDAFVDEHAPAPWRVTPRRTPRSMHG